MPLDSYSPCPGGTGKKLKFCCSDLVQELDKVERMLQGEQPTACLEHVRRLDERYPGRACLQSYRVALEMEVHGSEAAQSAIDAFIESHPHNPIALMDKALSVATTDPTSAMRLFDQSLEACGSEISVQVYDAIRTMANLMLISGKLFAARGCLQLRLSLTGGQDEEARRALLEFEKAESIPVLFKDMPQLQAAPEGAAWQAKFDDALKQFHAGHWQKAEAAWSALASEAGDFPGLWRNLALVRAFLADNRGAAAALRKITSPPATLDEAVEAESLAQLLARESEELQIDIISVTYPVLNAEAVQEKLASDRRFERGEADPASWANDDEPPPRAMYALLDRPPLASGRDITRDQIPVRLAIVALFGKQTDREARIEIIISRPERGKVETILAEVFGDTLGKASDEKVLDKQSHVEYALNWAWRLPDDTPEALRASLIAEQRREMILKRWPELSQPLFGGRTPRQAAQEPAYRVRLLASIRLLELTDELPEGGIFNELRRTLGLPEQSDIDGKDIDIVKMPVSRLAQLDPKSLSDDQLRLALGMAMVPRFRLALSRLAPEVIARESFTDVEARQAAHQTLVTMAPTSDEALKHIDAGRAAAKVAGLSCATWDLIELTHRLRRFESEKAVALMRHLQAAHGREPGVAESLMGLLSQLGLIGPDGLPRAARSTRADSPDAGQSNQLWTPEDGQTSAASSPGDKGSSLWLPD